MAKYQKYVEYKDSDVEWLGEIPSHWSAKRLGSFFEERREKVSDVDYTALSVTKNGIVPQLDTAAKTDAGDNRKLVKVNDFVINSRSDRKGSSGVSPYTGSVSLISIVMEPRRIYPAYAHHLLRSYPFQEEFYRYGKGIVADLWSTNSSEMKNILLPDLPIAEQQNIANFLDHETAKIDTLIAKQEKLIELLKEKRQAVISLAVTKGLNPNVTMKDSGVEWLGEVPEHWEKKILKYIVSQQGGGTPDKSNLSFWDGDIPWVSPKDMKVDYISTSQDKITVQAIEQSSTKLVPIGSVLMVVRGMILIHSVPVALTKEGLTINQDMKALIPNKLLNSEYFLYLLKGLKDYLLDYVETSGHGTKCLRSDDFMNMPLFLPDVEEQKNIVEYIKIKSKKFDSLTDKAESAIQLMKERRTALISAAVTGKIDVRHWQSPNKNNNQNNMELSA